MITSLAPGDLLWAGNSSCAHLQLLRRAIEAHPRTSESESAFETRPPGDCVRIEVCRAQPAAEEAPVSPLEPENHEYQLITVGVTGISKEGDSRPLSYISTEP